MCQTRIVSLYHLSCHKCAIITMAKQQKSIKKFGFSPRGFRRNVLPTHEHIIQAINFENQRNCRKILIKPVVKELILLWKESSLPTVTIKTITDKVNRYYKEYLQIAQGNTSRLNYQSKVEMFKVITNVYIEFSEFCTNCSKLF